MQLILDKEKRSKRKNKPLQVHLPLQHFKSWTLDKVNNVLS